MIKISNLTKIFNKKTPSEIKALDNISLEINDGEIVSIIGKSGSGKTTLSNILLGVLKPTSGELDINGIKVNRKTKRRQLRKITNILLSSFQYPDHQLFKTNVKDELLFNSDDEEYMYELMKKLNIDKDLLDRSPYKLSSGEKRKVILCSLLIQKPKIIIFDEATAFLDPRSRKELTNLIKEVNINLGMTIIFISHNIKDVLRISDKVILLEKGKIVFQGNPKKATDMFKKGGDYE